MRNQHTPVKFGRNDPCWCGSGKKYKRCHLNRAQAQPATIQEMISTTNKIFGKQYCLHPNAGAACNGGIIRAHTIQRNGGLSRIARQGHVYTFVPDLITLIKTEGHGAPKLTGYKEATTFTGFCASHDNTTFAPIETHPFNSNEQHTFLLAYRAICKELYAKSAQLDLISYQQTLDRGHNPTEQLQIQAFFASLKIGVELGLKNLHAYKIPYDDALQRSDFSQAHYYVIRLANIPDFLCSGAILPEHDFQGRLLQSLSNAHVDHITFSLVATEAGGAAVFSWLGDSPSGLKLVQSLDMLSDVDIL